MKCYNFIIQVKIKEKLEKADLNKISISQENVIVAVLIDSLYI